MRPTPKRWTVSERLSEECFAQLPDLHPLIVQLLYNRHITKTGEMRAFLDCQPPDNTDPFQLKGMAEAVRRLRHAIQEGELIVVYGDYDADGVTATALMWQVLTTLGGQVYPYIPDRFDEGYGLNVNALSNLAGKGARIVLTVDCGIRSIAEVEYGNQLGLDMILTDHHLPGKQVPPALAIINPKQEGCHYPFKYLAGVGLAFKLAQALMQVSSPSSLVEEDLLDLVALGTVADIAPLSSENRSLVYRGLEQLNTPHRLGVQKLMAQARIRPGNVDASTIGFVLGPRLNAAGRLKSAMDAYHLLVTDDVSRAEELAEQLDSQNRNRQSMTQDAVELARQEILRDEVSHRLYVITHPSFNSGIVGLVASRLMDEFYRPILVGHKGETYTRGSARSITGFHITRALDKCEDLLKRYGGHSAAAGFTIKNENLPEFEERLLALAEQDLDDAQMIPELEIDARLQLRGINRVGVEDVLSARHAGRSVDETDLDKRTREGLKIMDVFTNLQPFGERNPAPLFETDGLEVKGKSQVGSDGNHLKLVLWDGKQTWNAIAFRQGSWHDYIPEYVDVAYMLETNEWNGRQRLQLNIKDIKPNGAVEE